MSNINSLSAAKRILAAARRKYGRPVNVIVRATARISVGCPFDETYTALICAGCPADCAWEHSIHRTPPDGARLGCFDDQVSAAFAIGARLDHPPETAR